MKFFSLCLFILSSFFAIAQTPVPEQDQQYFQQSKDENSHGCVTYGYIQSKPHISICTRYCRPLEDGDNDDYGDIIVHCRGEISRGGDPAFFSCSGVGGTTQEEARAEARSICIYKMSRYCRTGMNRCRDQRNRYIRSRDLRRFVSCQPPTICFDVDYDDNDRPMIVTNN